MAATGVVELMDDRSRPLVPRWLSWFSLLGALGILGAAGPAFFRSGPFAYHGLRAFYVPVVIWGAYITLTSVYMLKSLGREAAASAPDATPVAASH